MGRGNDPQPVNDDALAQVRDIAGKTIVVVASGGNVDADTYAEALRRGAVRP